MSSRSRRFRIGVCRPAGRSGKVGLLGCLALLGAALIDPEQLIAAEGPSGEAVQEKQVAREEEQLERRLSELEAQVAVLQQEIARLRAGSGGGGSEAFADIERRIQALTLEIERMRIGRAAAPVAGESAHGFGPAASKVYGTRRGVAIGGYGEMLYENFNGETDGGASSMKTDQADLLRAVLYFGYKFNDRFLFNSEIEFEHALAGEGKDGEVAVEFAYLDFKATDHFGVRGGLVLVPLGFINELHEPPVFHGARRPEVERTIIPTTWRENGIGVYGDAGSLTYRAYLTTSLEAIGFSAKGGIRGGRQSGSKSKAEDLAITARIDWSPKPGFLLGASAFTGGTAQGFAGLDEARLTVWDAHAEWAWRGLRLRGLYAKSILSEADAVSLATGEVIGERQQGWYGEIAWNLLAPWRGTDQDLSPFFRYEEFNTQEEVPTSLTADPENDRRVRSYGVTYRPIPNVALKLEFQNRSNGALISTDQAVDQVNFALGYLF